ncbi:MAG: ATP-grasp domain-containing protein [Caldilineaceae bacterium]|nr:ATP-grasp domain-containing protein [Caldilineaceae bacterium]
MMSTRPEKSRILLLTTTRSYRNDAFLQAADRLNIELIQAVDMTKELADYWHCSLGVDFNDPQGAVQTIVDYAAQEPLHAILAVDDSGTLLAARAAAALGLPHNAPVAAEAARNKLMMRTLMANAGVPCPIFRHFACDDDPQVVAAKVTYPCVVKPLNLNGSRGVIRADNPAEFVAAVERLTRLLASEAGNGAPPMYLVEDFIPGFEVAVEGMLDNGDLTVLALFDKPDPLDGPFFEETIYVTPSRLPASTQQAIADTVALAASALGLQMGPVHAELRVNDNGPWMLEIAGRSIGGLCSQILRFGVDASLEELILRQAVGLGIESANRAGSAVGVMMIPIPQAGILQRVNGLDAAAAVDGITGVEITARIGYPIQPLPEGESYLGFLFAKGETPAAVEAALRMAHEQLHFVIVPEIALALG